MTDTPTATRTRMTRGKFNGINAIADERGVIRAAAMDQRGSLRKSITKARGSEATAEDLATFKAIGTEVLTPYASAILMDPEFGLEAIKHRAPNAGVLLAYEKTGYDAAQKGRLPDLLDEWSVRRLIEAGADAIKILLYYDPDDDDDWVNRIKQAFIERVGAECRGNDVPFFLELLAYSDQIPDEKSIEFANAKPDKVRKYMEEFSKPQYGVDILKVEVPINIAFVEGSTANTGGEVAYSRDQAMALFRQAAAAARLPFIYLSAGVTDEVFRETLELAIEADVPFAGVLCGRATWQDGIPVFGKEGPEAFRAWLQGRGVENIEMLNAILAQGAHAWWEFYGGKDNIEVVDGPA
jgi:tagatose 1,6-diphosphate aldolase